MCSTKKANKIVKNLERGRKDFLANMPEIIEKSLKEVRMSGVDFEKIRRKLVDGNKN